MIFICYRYMQAYVQQQLVNICEVILWALWQSVTVTPAALCTLGARKGTGGICDVWSRRSKYPYSSPRRIDAGIMIGLVLDDGRSLKADIMSSRVRCQPRTQGQRLKSWDCPQSPGQIKIEGPEIQPSPPDCYIIG